MGEVILGSLADSVLGHLTSLISHEIGQACGVKTELENLRRTFSAIKAVLSEAERRQIEEKDVKHWLKELSDVVYDVEDLLDEFSTEALRRGAMGGNRILKEVRIFFSSSNRLFYSFKMAHRVKDIRETLDAIDRDKSKYNLNQNNVGNPAASGRVPYLDCNLLEKRVQLDDIPFLSESYVSGRVEDKKEICRFLLDPTLDESVFGIAIVGIGGIGKTTLAKLIYNDQSVHEHFELKLWACVSFNFDVEAIVKKLVQKCHSNRKLEDCSMDELPKQLDGKRCLIVLDDVWNENRHEWLKLEGFFKNGVRGSKILVTTRSLDVANTMMPIRVHRLEGLPEDEALSLLKLMACKPEHEWNDRGLEAIGREIVRKCGRVPLAIATIGRLLCLKDTRDWSEFSRRDLTKVKQEKGDILPTLKLSYDILPSDLKQCFAYCSLFPNDYELNPDELIHLWMAQGFIRSLDSNRTLEDVGWDCFKELAGRIFFQDLEKDVYGNIVKCKMHDLMHDLARLMAADNFITADDFDAGKLDGKEARHISIINMGGFKWKGGERRRIRSLLYLGCWIENRWDQVTPSFKNIRLLSLVDVGLEVVPKSIGKLKHLRCLDLSENWGIIALPSSISKLHNLETLNLRQCLSLFELPRGITKLINLRQLKISGCDRLTHMPKGIEKLTNLQMLSDFVVGEKGNSNAAGLDELNRLKGLKKRLAIHFLGRVEDTLHQSNTPFFVKNSTIKVLKLDWKRYGEVEQSEETEDFEERQANQEAILERLQPHSNLMGLELCNYSGRTFSSWVSQWHNLVHLVIKGCYFCKSLPPIHQFPSLKSLELEKLNTLEYIEVEERGNQNSVFFPLLESVVFDNLPNFKGWRWMHGDNDDNDDIMIPLFPKRIQCITEGCPNFSYATHELLSLVNATEKLVQQLVSNGKGQTPPPKEEVMAATAPSLIFMSSMPTLAWKSLYIKNLATNALPEELFHSLSHTLQHLEIVDAPHLKSLPLRAILGHLLALEYLEIGNCPELDLSTSSVLEEEADAQLNHGHINSRIRDVCIYGVVLMNSLPWWFQHLSGLEILTISNCSGLQDLTRLMCCLTSLKELSIYSCGGLKSLSRRVILHLLSTLEKLDIEFCPELDLNRDRDEEDDNVNLHSVDQSPLRKLYLNKSKAESLPWWIEHLNNLETLSISACENVMALPEWFTKLSSLRRLYIYGCPLLKERCQKNGPDWPKISRIQHIYLDDRRIQPGNGD